MRANFRSSQLLLFSLLLTVYTLTNSGTFHIIDEVSLFAVTESAAQRGEVDTNAVAWTQWVNSPGEVLGAFGADGEVYSKKGPAPAFLSLPWYWLIALFARLGLPWGLLQGTLLWNGVVTAATAILLWRTSTRLGYDDRVGLILSLTFGLGTIAWPYANHLFGEPLSAFGLLLCFYGVIHFNAETQRGRGAEREGKREEGKERGREGANTQSAIRNPQSAIRNSLLAGIGAAIAVATVTAHAPLIAVLGIYLIVVVMRGRRTADGRRRTTDDVICPSQFSIRNSQLAIRFFCLLPFAFCLLSAFLLLLFYNAARFGHSLETGYHFDSGEGFTTPIWQGFWGLIISPYRGVFWHTPIFILSLCAFPAFVRRHRAAGIVITALSLILVGLYSAWWMWWGGFAWGPRFLVPLTPFWILALAPVLERMNKDLRMGRGVLTPLPILYLLFFVLSFLVQLSAVIVNYVNYEIALRSIFPTDWADPLRFGPPAQGIADWIHSPVLGQWRLMTEDFVLNTDLAWLWPDGTVLWSVVIVGGLAMIVLASVLGIGYWGLEIGDRGLGIGTRTTHYALRTTNHELLITHYSLLITPLLVIAVWLTAVGQHPHYGEPGQGYRAILAEVEAEARADQALVTVAPYHYQIPMNWYAGGLPIFGYATDSIIHHEAVMVLDAALHAHPQIWYVTAGLPPTDANNLVERWLADHAYKADDRWFDDFRLVRYGTPAGLASAPIRPTDDMLYDGRNRVGISAVRAPSMIRAGATLPVEIHYRVEEATDPLRWFVQLLGADGALAALLDTAPLDGYAAFPDLASGGKLVERAGLTISPDLAAGEYRLVVGIYNPAAEGAPRLRTDQNVDFLDLGTVIVE
ncbi:MAG: hypothetical protein KF893_00690 [Caldilineaceae bacterium]|nr:hypothetical protein [Caldilineaceae bacterium]